MKDQHITFAYWTALGAHGDQKYDGLPYVEAHVGKVVMILLEAGFSPEADSDLFKAAWLHDTVEDTNLTVDIIRVHFGDEVANLVWAVTGVGENRKARNASIYEKISHYPPAAILKTADRIANVEASHAGNPGLFNMYQREKNDFLKAIGDQVPDVLRDRLLRAFV